MSMKSSLATILAATALMSAPVGGGGSTKRRRNCEFFFTPKEWAKRQKRNRMQKESRKMNWK